MPTKSKTDPLISTLNHLLSRKLDPIVNKLERMDLRIIQLHSTQQTFDRKLNDLDLKIDNLDGKVDSLTKKVNTLDKRTYQLELKTNKIEKRIIKLDHRVVLLDEKTDNIQSELTELIRFTDKENSKIKTRVVRLENQPIASN